MANFNKIILIGRIACDLELKQTNNGKSVLSFSVAVDRTAKDAEGKYITDFLQVIAWGKTAEFVRNYFAKGRSILVEGRLQTRNYTGTDGVKRYVTEVVAEKAEFVDEKPTAGNADGVPTPYSGVDAGGAGLVELDDDGELPF